jgi:hypothetical protein
MAFLGLLFLSRFAVAQSFTFYVTSDQGYTAGPYRDNMRNFRGVCESIALLEPGAFMISPGDLTPAGDIHWTLKKYLGESIIWYPVVGNHDVDEEGVMWLRGYNERGNELPYIVNQGPRRCIETTYSFDYENAHFVILNEYFDGESDTGADGDICDALLGWLENDLQMTEKELIFVIGHEPAFPQPDADNGVVRHPGSCLNQYPEHRDNFWRVLKEYDVFAYICGHAHTYNASQIDGVWQIQSGHARGDDEPSAPSTFLKIHVDGMLVTVDVYRETGEDWDYQDIHHTFSNRISVEAKVILQGPYDPVTDSMTTHLNTAGYLPKTSPYVEDSRTVEDIPEDVTDWVLVELMTHPDSAAVAQRSAFLHSDGRIVDDDGLNGQLPFRVLEGAYYLRIQHRNHLSVMSQEPLNFGYLEPTVYDFTQGLHQYFGGEAAQVDHEPEVYGLYAADVNQDGMVKLADELARIRPKNLHMGYLNEDVDLNGVVSLASELNRVRKNALRATHAK